MVAREWVLVLFRNNEAEPAQKREGSRSTQEEGDNDKVHVMWEWEGDDEGRKSPSEDRGTTPQD